MEWTRAQWRRFFVEGLFLVTVRFATVWRGWGGHMVSYYGQAYVTARRISKRALTDGGFAQNGSHYGRIG